MDNKLEQEFRRKFSNHIKNEHWVTAIWEWLAIQTNYKSFPLDAGVKPACGYCNDCKFWEEKSLECKNDVIWLNKDKNIFYNISDLRTDYFFGCIRFKSKSV